VRPLRYPLTVFYDASCPMCATEMHALRNYDRLGRIALIDCSAPDFDDAPLIGDGIKRQDLMGLMHARDAHGRWLVGIDAFEAIYRAAGMVRIAKIWANPRLRPLFTRLYPWIARYRQALSSLGLHIVVRLAFSAALANRPGGSCPRP
jgi:predicted DCC family thiol-disulfide oxidoreductase YuxK